MVLSSLNRTFAVENLYTMRNKVFYIILLTLVLSACTSPGHEAMRQRLKYVSDCNRADTVFTERWLPTVDSLVTYFDRHGSANDRMMAHYVQGRVYHDMGEAPQALECYQLAAEVADTTSSDCDLYTLYAVYGQMANIFHSQYLPDDEMQALIAAERIAWKDKDTLTALNTYELRIRPFFLKSDTDSILLIARDAYSRFQKHHSISKSITSLPILINICIAQNKVKEAFNWISIYEQESDHFDDNGNIIPGREVYYYDKGKYELAQGRLDSATVLFQKALRAGFKEAGYRGLLSVYEKKNYPDSIAKYAKLFAAANDSSYLHVNQNTVHQISAMYNYSRQQKLAEKHAKEARKARRDKILLCSLIPLLLIAFIIFIRKWRHQSEKKYLRLSLIYDRTKSELAASIDRQRLLRYSYEAIAQEKEEEKENLLSQILAKEQEIQRLKEKARQTEEKLQQFTSVDMEAAFKKSEIYQLFNARKSPKYVNNPPSESDWQKLTDLFRTHFVCYYSFLTYDHNLSINQLRYCILVRLGFDGTEIGILMDKDKDQRYHLRRFAYEELFGYPINVKMLEERLKQYY